MLSIFRFPGFQNLLARLENPTDSKLLPQRCTYSINWFVAQAAMNCATLLDTIMTCLVEPMGFMAQAWGLLEFRECDCLRSRKQNVTSGPDREHLV